MKFVPEKVGAVAAPVSIENPEKGAPRPLGAGFVFGLHHIKNDADSVFVVVSDQTLIGIGCVSPDHTVALSTRLRRLVWNALW